MDLLSFVCQLFLFSLNILGFYLVAFCICFDLFNIQMALCVFYPVLFCKADFVVIAGLEIIFCVLWLTNFVITAKVSKKSGFESFKNGCFQIFLIIFFCRLSEKLAPAVFTPFPIFLKKLMTSRPIVSSVGEYGL